MQYLKRVTDKSACLLDDAVLAMLIDSATVEVNVNLARRCLAEDNLDGYRKAKSLLPAIMWCGQSADFERKADKLKATGLYMVDIDHMTENVEKVYREVVEPRTQELFIIGAHITPSGKGLRLIAVACKQELNTLQANMDWLVDELKLKQYGDYDTVCRDYSRLSFVVPRSDWFLVPPIADYSHNSPLHNIQAEEEVAEERSEAGAVSANEAVAEVKPKEVDKEGVLFKGAKVGDIIDKYVEQYGVPSAGERHAYYNNMVRNFRNMLDNDPELIASMLPLFGKPYEYRLSQCKSITKTNNTSRFSKEFFFFLVDNGFYPTDKKSKNLALKEYIEEEPEEPAPDVIPPLPPVFREFVSIAPPDFKLPVINALMPLMGTLTSYVRANYFDHREHSTSFFNVIYAPAGSGKSFVFKLMEPLLSNIELRDEIATMREAIYLNVKSAKGANEKDPKDPHVSVRIMPAINSQPEFLQKMRDNKGYHMFTFAEEVDTFAKGQRAGGVDKSDMYRVAWDNGLYGQSFKSANTFKGRVKLFYNILMTGTPNQVRNYYKNTENGMVTRVAFCEIPNQEFREYQSWKQLSRKQLETIGKFVNRCDNNTYTRPLDYSVEDALEVEEKDFDEAVPWNYQFRPFEYVDMSFIFKSLLEFDRKQRVQASAENNMARDTFRRRTAVKGFRLALICTQCWKKITKKEEKIIIDFVKWWMEKDIEESLKLFGDKMNDEMQESLNVHNNKRAGVLASLPTVFEKSDIVAQCLKQGVKTNARQLVCRWKKDKLIESIGDNKYKKL
ncbi:MAG: DUF3987 domain-containing protein [Prevotella sp.]|nr:DUF3987 domain-containing protein [Candidatus Prevotella equi]